MKKRNKIYKNITLLLVGIIGRVVFLQRKNLKCLLVLAYLIINENVICASIFSSYPSNNSGIFGSSGGQIGALFTTDANNYSVASITAPLSFNRGYTLPGATYNLVLDSTNVNFQLWTSASSPLFEDGRQRPDQLIGSWISDLIPAADYGANVGKYFFDISAFPGGNITLNPNSSYWLIIDPMWTGMNSNAGLYWAGSETITGGGHGLETIFWNPMPPYGPYSNIDIGGFPAFMIEGQVLTIPEPSTYALLGMGSLGLLMVLRRKKSV